MNRRTREYSRLLTQARVLLERGELEQAHATLEAVLREAPRHYAALLAVARLELARDRVSTVIFQARRLIRLDPSRTEGYRLLAQVLLAAGRTGEAVAVAREAVSRVPQEADLLIDLAHAHMYAGDLVAAARAAEEAVQAAPALPEPYATLARLAWQADEPFESLRLYDEAISRTRATGGARRQYRLERERVATRIQTLERSTRPPRGTAVGRARRAWPARRVRRADVGRPSGGGRRAASTGRAAIPQVRAYSRSPSGPDDDDVVDLRETLEQELVIDLRDMLEHEPEGPLRLPFRWPGRDR